MASALFSPLRLRAVTIRNRVGVSPMCQYSSDNGFANDWHLVHLGSRAVGGAGIVFTEATAVTAEGRISPADLGIYSDAHIEGLARITRMIHDQGAAAGIQLAHAGRKASTRRPWEGTGAVPIEAGGWHVIGPGTEPFSGSYPVPRPAEPEEIPALVDGFATSARRAQQAGFDVIEIHAAHGYLLHQFLSPLTNHRSDGYGGGFEGRQRLLLEVVDAVRAVIPDAMPLQVRLSATDWTRGGLTIEDTMALSTTLHARGVDVIDCSSGGLVPDAAIPVGPGYQIPFAAAVRATGIMTAAVGLITDARQAEGIIAGGHADYVLLARALLRDPYWPLNASRQLGAPQPRPAQYQRADP